MDDLKAKLLTPWLEEDDVELPGVGTVRVRALNRLEVMKVQRANGDIAATERIIVASGMVNPAMTEAEVARWQKGRRGGEVGRVSDRIAELSGMTEDAGKQRTKEFIADPALEFRTVPGAEAVDDGGAAAGGDE